MKKLTLGIIPDGNRRYAKKHGKDALWGHEEGFKNFKKIITYCVNIEAIEHLAIYAFSTENWKREKKELDHLLGLFEKMFIYTKDTLSKEGVKIKIIGDFGKLTKGLVETANKIEQLTKSNKKLTLWTAISYGGRAEIADAARRAIKQNAQINKENDFKKFLWSAEMPDIDIMIRTGGEKRLSNFFPWHLSYAELFFVDKYWPEFNTKDLDRILEEYSKRERRMGK